MFFVIWFARGDNLLVSLYVIHLYFAFKSIPFNGPKNPKEGSMEMLHINLSSLEDSNVMFRACNVEFSDFIWDMW